MRSPSFVYLRPSPSLPPSPSPSPSRSPWGGRTRAQSPSPRQEQQQPPPRRQRRTAVRHSCGERRDKGETMGCQQTRPKKTTSRSFRLCRLATHERERGTLSALSLCFQCKEKRVCVCVCVCGRGDTQRMLRTKRPLFRFVLFGLSRRFAPLRPLPLPPPFPLSSSLSAPPLSVCSPCVCLCRT